MEVPKQCSEMSSVLLHEDYILCSNKDADKDVNVTDQLWELQASVVPGSPPSDCPCATGTGAAAPQLGAVPLCEPSESRACRLTAPHPRDESSTEQALHELLKTLSPPST